MRTPVTLSVWKKKKDEQKKSSKNDKFEQVREWFGMREEDFTEDKTVGEEMDREGMEIEQERDKFQKSLNDDVQYLKKEIKTSIATLNAIISHVRDSSMKRNDEKMLARKTEVISKLFDSKIKCTSQLLDVHKMHKFLLELRLTEKAGKNTKMTTARLKELFESMKINGSEDDEEKPFTTF